MDNTPVLNEPRKAATDTLDSLGERLSGNEFHDEELAPDSSMP